MLLFTRPRIGDKERAYLEDVLSGRGKLSGDGPFTQRCHRWLETELPVHRALLTNSCTVALEVAAILAELGPGDEVIMPSFTFASTANAVVLRGAVPVFAEIRQDTRNLDESKIEALITPRTRAIMPVHYAGVACAMDPILEIARRHQLIVIEDAAQGMRARYRGKALGTLGDLGCISFHETKTVVAGEGGALVTNDPALAMRAEIVREKGTDRSRFLRGEVDRYTWRDVGTSALPPEMVAAFLLAQLEDSAEIVAGYLAAWERYHTLVAPLEAKGLLRRPVVPEDCVHNGHIYGVLLDRRFERDKVAQAMKAEGVSALAHYQPLHSAPAGIRFGRTPEPLPVTDYVAGWLLRLPIYADTAVADQERAVAALSAALTG